MSGKYILAEFLGSGACGSVYRAVPRVDLAAPSVAIKCFHNQDDPASRESAQSEAHVLRMLWDPAERVSQPPSAIIRFIEYLPQEHQLVLEYFAGIALIRFLKPYKNPIASQVAQVIGKQLLEALAYLHDVGFAHCDVKLENVLVSPQQQHEIRLIDFGFARCASSPRPHNAYGTVTYWPPELLPPPHYDVSAPIPLQSQQRRSDIWRHASLLDFQRADVFACGILCYELARGKPFDSEQDENGAYTEMQLLRLHLLQDSEFEWPENVHLAAISHCKLLERVIAACCTPDPRKRLSARRIFEFFSCAPQ